MESYQPSCYLLGFVDNYGRVIVLDGFHKSELSYDLHPGMVREIRARYSGLLTGYGVNYPIWADPGIFRRQIVAKQDTGSTLASLLSGFGLHLKPAQNDIAPGIAKVSGYLADKFGVPHIVTGEPAGPMIYFIDDMPFIQDEFGGYFWKRNPLGNHIDEPVDNNDHAMDTIKYMLSKLPEASKVVIPGKQQTKSWMRWQEMEQSDYERRQQSSV
jgi:hypothetical protein